VRQVVGAQEHVHVRVHWINLGLVIIE